MENSNNIIVPKDTGNPLKESPVVLVDSEKSLSEKQFDQTRTVSPHHHNDIDSDKIKYEDLDEKPSLNFTISETWKDTEPQTANNFYGGIWIANVACQIVSIRERHEDNASSALTLDVYKSGTSVLASVMNLASNNGVTNLASLSTTIANLRFAVGDNLSVGPSGSVAGVRGLNIVVEFKPI